MHRSLVFASFNKKLIETRAKSAVTDIIHAKKSDRFHGKTCFFFLVESSVLAVEVVTVCLRS